MSLLLSSHDECLIQGITGKEGQRVAEWMIHGGTRVVAGVTPGKGGQMVLGVPVYNSVQEALDSHPDVKCSALYMPPQFVLSAALEAMDARIPLLHIIAEAVPTRDTVEILEKARETKTRVLGPGAVGFVNPGKNTVGSITGGNMEQFLAPGDSRANDAWLNKKTGVAVISKSGGMTTTVAGMLTRAGIPQSSLIGLGGNKIVGMTFADLMPDLAQDEETEAVVLVGEIGGSYEEAFAEELQKQNFNKKVVAFVSGLFAETLPQGVAFGHAGAIVSKTEGTRAGKIKALKSAGVTAVESPMDIIDVLDGRKDF